MNQVVEIKPAGGALAQTNSPGRMAVAEIIQHVAIVQEVMKAVMKEGVHYGKIPGAGDKNTLLKPGAEVLCMAFRVADTYEVEDLSTADKIRYRVNCIGTHQLSGAVLGSGLGEASSSEEKYKWRKAICKEEFEETPANLRRKKFAKAKGGGFYMQEQVRTEPDDLANTVLKMANKRAKVAMTINVTACGDMFAQDLEDMDAALREHLTRHEGDESAQPEQPAAAEKKAFPDDAFAQNMGAWQKAVNKGKAPAEVLATVEKFNQEFALSDAQRAKILALKAGGAATDAAPKVTFAQIDEKMRAARTPDQLNEVAALIGAITDQKQQEELKATYQELINAMSDAQPGSVV